MSWLLWKDYRHNRMVVIAGVCILLALYLIAVCLVLWSRVMVLSDWKHMIAIASVYSLSISQLTVALIGGNAIAGERVDRSAEFLAALPITRKKILASKLLLALIIIATIWLIDASAAYCLRETFWNYPPGAPEVRAGWTPEARAAFLEVAANIALTGLLFFGVAWFLSSFLTSPTFSICGGLLAPVLFWLSLVVATDVLRLVPGFTGKGVEIPYRIYCLALGPAGFAIGTWYYLRRVEP
jgi:ABC-type transport system involved in multi-copper enzyme maturation permease subunit